MRVPGQTRHAHFVPYIPRTLLGHAHRPGAPPQSDNPDTKESTLSMRPLKTYIVEDSQVIRENLIATLEELVPVEVVGTAEDETTAVQWLARASNHADLLIVDIFLKGGSGLGVLRAASALAQRRTRGGAEQLRHAGHAEQVPGTRRRPGVRQVQRDRCADPVLRPAGGRRNRPRDRRWPERAHATGSARSSARSRSGRCSTRAPSSPSPGCDRC